MSIAIGVALWRSVGLGGRFGVWFFILHGPVFDAVASAGDGGDLGVVQKAVEDGVGGGDIADELAPVLRRPVARLANKAFK